MATDIKTNEEINSEKAKDIRTTARTNLFQRLAARFGFVVVNNPDERKRKTKQSSTFQLIQKPTETQLLDKSPKEELDLISKLAASQKLSSTVQDLFEEWAEDTQNTYANIQEREERLNAFTYMVDNEGIVKSAVNLVASETASLSDICAFGVTSEDKKWQEDINYMLKDVWRFDQPTIYSLAWNIFLYGEAFQGREVTSAGIIGLNHIGVNEIAERLEFKPAKVAEFKMQMQAGSGNQSTGFTTNLTRPTNSTFGQSNLNFNFGNKQITYKSTDNLLKDYIEHLADVSSAEYFTSHLLGYRIFGDMLVAPWQVSHYRFNAGVSEFWPYGQPPLLACLSAYKQLQRVMGLDDLEKLLSMPIRLYKVKTNGATVGRAFDIVNTVKERFENVGLVSAAAGMEGPSLCTNIWTSDDLVNIEVVESSKSSDSGATDKMKFFNSRLTTATGIPMSYIDPSSEGFQMSGVALATLFKPFRTLIENIRGIITREVEDTIRLHDSIRGVETPEFVITMNVINPVATEDTSSKLELAEKVLDTVAMLLGVEKEKLPKGIKKDVLVRYADISNTELENYEATFETEGIEDSEISEEESEASFGEESEIPDEESSEDLGENTIKDLRRLEKKLIQERYNLAKKSTDLKYYLVERLKTLKTRNGTSSFCEGWSDRHNSEFGQFLLNRPKTRHGKKQITD